MIVPEETNLENTDSSFNFSIKYVIVLLYTQSYIILHLSFKNYILTLNFS